ncbi:PDZ domain-containing protein [Aphelenchoides bicaudatus]|nr:PDZ domain-containing protein [Aphelenchoides bicaudatus]
MSTRIQGYGHEAGAPLECLSICVELTKAHQIDPVTGEAVEKVGFRLGGGIDQDQTNSPYPDRGIYITHVEPNSPAEKVGLKRHDKILQINNIDCTMATHKQVIKCIQRNSKLRILIARREIAI